MYVRSILEQSCVVWNSSLSEENIEDLERVQKAAVRVMLGQKYTNYEDGLEKLNLKKLADRRNELCLKFAKKCLENEKNTALFPTEEQKTSNDNKKTSQVFSKQSKNKKTPIICHTNDAKTVESRSSEKNDWKLLV